MLFVHSEVLFDPSDQRTTMYVSLFLVNAALNWMIGSYFEKRRKEALNDPQIAEKNTIKWEVPATLFFIKIKWWGLIFIFMIIYFLQFGYVPVMTDRI